MKRTIKISISASLVLVLALLLTALIYRDELLGYFYSKAGIYDLSNKNIESALYHLEKSVEASPENPYPHYRLGLCYISLGDIENATAQHAILEDLKPRLAGKLLRAMQKAGDKAGEDKAINGQ